MNSDQTQSSGPLFRWTDIPEKVRRAAPVVHCITNYVTAPWCADILLAAGAAPIMADEPDEMEEITGLAGALVLNIGTIRHSRLEAMRLAGAAAARLGRPVILDPVGAGASRLRTGSALEIIRDFHPAVVRGNISEILALSGQAGKSRGVDADPDALVRDGRLGESAALAASLAEKWMCTVVISGPYDIVSDGERTCAIGGGDPMMTRITGCGCMESALLGAYLAAEPDVWKASAAAMALMSLCGGRAASDVRAAGEGTASMRIRLLDAVSLFAGEELIAADVKIL